MVRSGRKVGSDFEYRVAKVTGGRVYSGQDGDVEARGWRIECKSRADLKLESTTTLRDWLDQIQRYEKSNPDTPFALAFTGGGSYQRGRIWVASDMDHWLRLTAPTNNRALLEELERIRLAIESRSE